MTNLENFTGILATQAYVDRKDTATTAAIGQINTIVDAIQKDLDNLTDDFDAMEYLRSATFDGATSMLSFTRRDNTTLNVPLYNAFEDVYLDGNDLVMTPFGGTSFRVPLSSIVPVLQGQTGAHIQVIVNGNTISANLIADSVTNAELANMPANTIKGNAGVGGNPQDLTAGQARTILNVEDGANNYVHPVHTVRNTALTGANVYSNVTVNNQGHVIDLTSRVLSPADIGAVTTADLNTAINTRLPLAGGTVTGMLNLHGGLRTNEVSEFYDNVHIQENLYVNREVPANANDTRVAPTSWVRDRIAEIDVAGLDFNNPIIVDNSWSIPQVLITMRDGWQTVRAGRYLIRGSATYPLVTAGSERWLPSLRNMFAVITVDRDTADPSSPFWAAGMPWGVLLKLEIIGGWNFPEWRFPINWEESDWDSEWNPIEHQLVIDGDFMPTVIDNMGFWLNSNANTAGSPPTTWAENWNTRGLINNDAIARGTRRLSMTGNVAQTDYNAIIQAGTNSIAQASVVANGPPLPIAGNMRRILNVTQTPNQGIIQELEVFSDNLSAPFFTWKRARRTNLATSWTPWILAAGGSGAGTELLFNGHVWGNNPITLIRRPLNNEILFVEGGFGDVSFRMVTRVVTTVNNFWLEGMVLGGHSTVFSQGHMNWWGGNANVITGSQSVGFHGGHQFNGWRGNISYENNDHWTTRITSLGGGT